MQLPVSYIPRVANRHGETEVLASYREGVWTHVVGDDDLERELHMDDGLLDNSREIRNRIAGNEVRRLELGIRRGERDVGLVGVGSQFWDVDRGGRGSEGNIDDEGLRFDEGCISVRSRYG